jgi:two-component system phosphate regulon sensor histidine kinase PhoR
VDLILEDSPALPEEVRGHLVTVQRNARRLHRLVDDLLSTALQSVTSVLDLRRMPLADQVRSSVLEAGKTASAAGLTFDFQQYDDGSELAVEGDAERLAQVFDNLFSNAVKYTPDGGHVAVQVTREVDHAVVRVCDTGRGISPEELGEIFSKFFRSSTVLSDAIPGIGLGLAITKSIVDAHGGQIAVSSKLGQGTTFEVRLPLATPASVVA